MTKEISAPDKIKLRPLNNTFFSSVTSLFLLCLALLSAIFFSDEISHSVKSGLSLCADVIIPSVFPFIILSDFLFAYVNFDTPAILGKAFEKTFKINRAGVSAFILGIICGFPLGVRCASELYKQGKITKDEAERLIGFANNTGPAFLIGGIGLGLRSNIRDGIILYISMLLSSVIVGVIFSYKKNAERLLEESSTGYFKNFTFTESVKGAGVGTLHICSYLTFFACICGLLRKALGECIPYLFIISFLEVGSSTSILSKTKLLSKSVTLSLSAFSVGFSGLSVHLQALSFISDTNLSVRKYFFMKLLQGILCAALCSVIILFVK